MAATVAPLVVGDLVITGVAGADEGIRGFVAAYKATTGQLVWRFWTVPAQGEPGSETWQGRHRVGGGSTWLTGSYDPETKLLYWPTGNPCPDTDGDRSQGRQSLHQLHSGAGCGDGKAALVFPVHAARPARLGCDGTAGAGRRALPGAAAQAAVAGRTATDSSMCSTGPTASFCWRRPFVKKSPGPAASVPTGRPC